MPPFVHVQAQRAGPDALGLLIPPGRQTLVIVRPRTLPWDLLVIQETTPPIFSNFPRPEAVSLAQELQKALDQAVQDGVNPVAIATVPQGQGFHVVLRAVERVWILCRREAGQPYRPEVFAKAEEVQAAATQLAQVLWPAADVTQEYYFNTQNFFC